MQKGSSGLRKSVVMVAGCRPEIIKLYPVYKSLINLGYDVEFLFTNQHKDLGEPVLCYFEMVYRNLCLKHDGDMVVFMSQLTDILSELYGIINPSIVVTQGDTLSAMIGGLLAYMRKIPYAHVESGLRSYNLYSPFPEEGYRKILDSIATWNFVPTEDSAGELNNYKGTYVVGNTVVDSLFFLEKAGLVKDEPPFFLPANRYIFATLHRKENIDSMKGIVKALCKISKLVPVVLVLHPNKCTRAIVTREKEQPNTKLLPIEPLLYVDCLSAIKNSYFVMTDSGGIQEECAVYGKPCLIMRNTTERMEYVYSGGAEIVSNEGKNIYDAALKLISDEKRYRNMIGKKNPYGDGKAGERIGKILDEELKKG